MSLQQPPEPLNPHSATGLAQIDHRPIPTCAVLLGHFASTIWTGLSSSKVSTVSAGTLIELPLVAI